MSTGDDSPKRETPNPPPVSSVSSVSLLPQKRALDDDHAPSVSSPLNPDFRSKAQDEAPVARDRVARAKKESLKKRESKAGSAAPDSGARATPDLKVGAKSKKKEKALEPIRYKLPAPKPSDFEPPRGPIFIPADTRPTAERPEITFHETTDQ